MRTLLTRGFGALALAAGSLLAAAPEASAGCGGSDCYRYVSRPPVYGSVSEQVMVRPPRTVHETIPPVFDTVSESVLVAPAGRVWQVSHDAYGQPVGCWVTIPPRYAVRTRRVLVRPPEVVPHVVPAAYATVSRRVLVEPGQAGWEPIGGHGYGGYGGYGGGRGGLGSSLFGAGAGLLDAGASVAGAGLGLGLGAVGGGAFGEGY